MVEAPFSIPAGNQAQPAATIAGNVPGNLVASSLGHTPPAAIYATPNAAISTLLPYNGLPPTSIAMAAPYQPAATTMATSYPVPSPSMTNPSISEGYAPVSTAFPADQNRTMPTPYPPYAGVPIFYNAAAAPTPYPAVNPTILNPVYPPYAPAYPQTRATLYPPQPCAPAPPGYPPGYPPQPPPHAPSGYPPVSAMESAYPPPTSRDYHQHQQHTQFSSQPPPSLGVYPPPPASRVYPPQQY